MCTRVLYETGYGTYMVGRNADWNDANAEGALWIFPRGTEREGAASDNPVTWTTRYGSVSMSVYGCISADGMNEEGLVCNMLFLAESDYGDLGAGGRPTLSTGAWVQYVLDNFKTVAEVVEAFRPDPFSLAPGMFGNGRPIDVHYCVSDATGDSAIFEYLDGKLVIHHGREHAVLTNSPDYEQQMAINTYWDLIGGNQMLPGTISSPDRYVRACYNLKSSPKSDTPREALASIFSQMRAVSTPLGMSDPVKPNISATLWRMYADSDSKKYYFDSSTDPSAFWVDLSKVDLSETAKPSSLLVSGPVDLAGDVSSQFTPAKPYKFVS